MLARILLVSETALNDVAGFAEAAQPRETGGILVGVRAIGGLWITSAVEAESDERTSHSFVLPAGVTPDLVETARRHDHRVGYLGDWHSHPHHVGASATDRSTMRRLARRLSRRHVLLVAMRAREGYEFEARLVGQLGDSPLEILTTGPLEPEETT